MATAKLTADTSQVTSALNDVNKGIRDIVTSTATLNSSTTASTQKQAEAYQSVADKIKSVGSELTQTITKSNAFTEVMSGINLVKEAWGFLASAVGSVKDTLMEMEAKATMKSALQGLSQEGENLNDVLSRTLEITRGVASGGSIQASVNTLMTQGFNLSAEALEKLIDVSGIYSSTTGQDMNTVMQKLAIGSQRERDATFEKMGVIIKTKEALEEYADSMGTTVDLLSESEKSNYLMIKAVDQLKNKFNEAGISAMSLESPISTVFNTMSANAKKVKYEISNYFSAIVGEILFVKRMNEENSQVFFQDLLNTSLAKTLKANKELSTEYVRQLDLVGGKLTDTQVEYYKKMYLLDKEQEQSKKVLSGQQLKDVKRIGEQKLDILVEQFKKEQGDTMSFELAKTNYLSIYKDKRSEMYKESARENLSETDFAQLGTTKMEKEIVKFDETGKRYVQKVKYTFDEVVNILSEGSGTGGTSLFGDFFKPPEQLDTDGTIASIDAEAERVSTELADKEQVRIDNLNTLKSKISNRNAENKYKQETTGERKKNEDLLKLEKEYFGDGGLLDQVQAENSKKDKIDEKKNIDEMKEYRRSAYLDQLTWEQDFDKQQADYKKEVDGDKLKVIKQEKEEKDKLDKEEKDKKQAVLDKANAVYTATAMSLYNDLIAGEEDYMQRALAVAMQTAGSEIFQDGIKRVWKGGGDMLDPLTFSKGAVQFGYGLLEMGAGATMGYAGAKIMPKTSSASESNSKETASQDRKANQKQSNTTDVYMYPDERSFLRSQKKAQQKLGGK